MKDLKKVNRRDLLKAAAVVSGFMIVPRRVLGGNGFLAPSDQITLGFIGCGKQTDGTLRNRFVATEAQVVAASDVYQAKLRTFTDEVDQYYGKKYGQEKYKACRGHADFRELLARPDIDAVVIAMPDHWHAAAAVLAAEAGKDIYCEKPLSLTVAEGRAMVNATRKHDRVFQTGSMQRSWPEFRQAVQLVRSGAIGQIKQVVVGVGGPPKPWNLEAEPTPSGLNWAAWMGPNTIDRPYNNQLAPTLDQKFWPQWRFVDEFGGGGMTDWGAHMFDIAQWGLGMDHSGPQEVIISGEGMDDGLVYKYANGVEMRHDSKNGNYCQFLGSDGEVWVARKKLKTSPESLTDKPFDNGENEVYFSDDHYQNFLDCIKSRKKPICDVEVGHRTASVCSIGNIAYKLGRPLRWDPVNEQFFGDKAANKRLERPMKKEWRV